MLARHTQLKLKTRGRTHDKLGLGVLLQNPREDVRNQVDTLLQTPTTDEHKQLSLGVLLEASPFLGLALELGPTSLESLVNGWLLDSQRLGVPLGIVLW